MTGEELVLYDLPSQGRCVSWSLNTWKARASLNYKKLPYRTEWVNFPKFESTFKELSIPPNPPGSFADYTVPVIGFPDGSYAMDSANIVKKLESMYPSPSLRLDPELEKQTARAMGAFSYPLLPVFMPRLRRDVQREDSAEWIKADRERRFGLPEEQWEREKGGEPAWQAAEQSASKFSEHLKAHKQDEGPFLLGSKVCFADFMIAGFCEMFNCIGSDVYDRLVGMVDGLQELHEACQPWFERNDH